MNFGQAFLFLFACATLGVVEGKGGTRGLATSRESNTFDDGSFTESLGSCVNGAVCGMWGDPHVITCDGYAYDCNRFGTFTAMDNHLWNIQTNFVPVLSADLNRVIDSGKAARATYTNDIGVKMPEKADVAPLFQFSFQEHISSESEHNCVEGNEWRPKLDGDGVDGVYAVSIEDCNLRCHEVDGCSKFEYNKSSNQCHFAGENATLVQLEVFDDEIIAGHVDRCGTGYEGRGENDSYAMLYGNGIRYMQEKICSILYYEDGVKVDISGKSTTANGNGDFLYGNETSDVSVQLHDRNKIRIKQRTLQTGTISEMMLETAGEGPGQKFGCHWNMWVCLPEAEKAEFANSLGLLGSADSNKTNDWTTRDGTEVVQQDPRNEGGFNYCKEWCVSQDDNFLVSPEGASFDDMKCHGEEYVDIHNVTCKFGQKEQDETCGSIEIVAMQDACRFECCMGECSNDTVVEIMKEIIPKTVVRLDEKEKDPLYNAPAPECDDQNQSDCLSSIVQVLHNTQGDLEIPTIYDINFPVSDGELGKQVTFKVSHSLNDNVDMYFRHLKKVGKYANDPVCHKEEAVEPGCTDTLLTAGCIEHIGDFASYALVDVYLASRLVTDPGTEIQKCCHPKVYDVGVNVVKYTFKIQCECPSDTTG